MRPIATGTLAAGGLGAIALIANPATAHAATMPALPEIPDNSADMVKSLAEKALPPAPEVPLQKGTAGVNNLLLRKEDTNINNIANEGNTNEYGDFNPGITVDDINNAAVNTQVAKVMQSFTGVDNKVAPSESIIGGTITRAQSAWNDLWHDTYVPFAEEGVQRTREEGVKGLSDLIDAMVTNPVATIQGAITASGGVEAWSNPQEALTRLVTSVVGPDYAADLMTVATELVIPALTKDLPLAALAGIATFLLAPLLPALAGAIAGGSLSGLMGSALGLAIAATVTYGAWLAIGLPIMLAIGLAIGIPVALGIIVIGIVLSFLTLGSPLPFLFSFGAAAISLLFMPILAVVLFVGATWWMPTLAFMLIAPLLMLGGGALGSIPGALMGGSLGYLAGLAAAGPLAALVFTLVGNELWNNRLKNNPDARDAYNRLTDLWNQAWRNSNTGRLMNSFWDSFWDSAIGRAIKPFVDAWNTLWANINWETLRNGALLGALRGIWDGLRTGFPKGALTGALLGLPLFLTTMAATLIPPAAIGFMAATFATALGSLPILAIAVPLWLLSVIPALVGFLMNGAGIWVTLAGAAIFAISLIATVIGTIGAIAFPPLGILGLIGGAGMFLGGMIFGAGLALFGAGWAIAGAAAGYAGVVATITALLIGGLFLLNLGIVGIPTFLLTAPLFVFPALAVQGPLYLALITSMGLLYGLVGAIYGAGSGGFKGLLAALPFALNWGGALEKLNINLPQGPNLDFNFNAPTPAAPATPERVEIPDFMSPNWGTNYETNRDQALVSLA